MRRSILAALLFVGLALPAAAAGDAEKGRKIAETDCARCHVIGDFNPRGGIGSTPSFPGLKTIADWRDRFRTFYARPPHIAYIRIEGVAQPKILEDYAAKLKFTLDDVEDIFAFAETIEKR